jgi:3-deoxy-7-phosphoheptulonate synthase
LKTVLKARKEIQNILSEKDDRLLVMVGPCSIHDPETAVEYASRLKSMADELQNEVLIVMRAYLEKPVHSLVLIIANK